METQNKVEVLDSEEFNVSVGEGTYQLQESLLLGFPGHHHSEIPTGQPPNPLDTRVLPPTAGSKLSLFIAASAAGVPRNLRSESPASAGDGSSQAGSHEQPESRSSKSISMFRSPDWGADIHEEQPTPMFGHDNPALTSVNGKEMKESGKKAKKPKSNLVKTNSSFVQRVQPADNLTKRLNERNPEGILAFVNVHRSLQWLDLSASERSHKAESLTKIVFSKAHVLCHDLNQHTATPNHIDLILGFSTGDIIWYDPTSQKYTRINKNGSINSTPVHDIKWIPNSANLFIASHGDGTLVVYDKEKEDVAFVPDNFDLPSIVYEKPKLQVFKSVQSQNQKNNPVAFWRVSKQRINGMAFSPDARHLAVGTEAGRLYVIDHHKERILDCFPSFFGGSQAVCWSPDGRYILSGGQDDMISIISFDEREVVARFQGHSSWITSVAFDPWRCDGRNYRFGSVADDRKLLLWDFNASMLQRPRAASIRQRASTSSNKMDFRNHSSAMDARFASETHLASQDDLVPMEDSDTGVLHPPKGWKDVPKVRAIAELVADSHEISWIGFHQQGIITSCAKGHIRMWDRPEESNSTDSRLSESRHRS